MSSTRLALILACLTVYSRVNCDPTFDILHPQTQGNANNLVKRDTSVKDENIHSLVKREVNGDLKRRIVIEMDEIKSLSRRHGESDHSIIKRSLDKKVNIRGQRINSKLQKNKRAPDKRLFKRSVENNDKERKPNVIKKDSKDLKVKTENKNVKKEAKDTKPQENNEDKAKPKENEEKGQPVNKKKIVKGKRKLSRKQRKNKNSNLDTRNNKIVKGKKRKIKPRKRKDKNLETRNNKSEENTDLKEESENDKSKETKDIQLETRSNKSEETKDIQLETRSNKSEENKDVKGKKLNAEQEKKVVKLETRTNKTKENTKVNVKPKKTKKKWIIGNLEVEDSESEEKVDEKEIKRVRNKLVTDYKEELNRTKPKTYRRLSKEEKQKRRNRTIAERRLRKKVMKQQRIAKKNKDVLFRKSVNGSKEYLNQIKPTKKMEFHDRLTRGQYMGSSSEELKKFKANKMRVKKIDGPDDKEFLRAKKKLAYRETNETVEQRLARHNIKTVESKEFENWEIRSSRESMEDRKRKGPGGQQNRRSGDNMDNRRKGSGGRDNGGFRANMDDRKRDSGGYRGSSGGYRGKMDDRSRDSGGYRGKMDDRGRGSEGYRGNMDDRRGSGGYRGSSGGYRGSSGGYRGNMDDRDRGPGGFRGDRDDRSRGPGGYRGDRDDRSRGPGGYRGDRDDRSRGPGGYRGNMDDRRGSGGYRGSSGGYRGKKDDQSRGFGGYRGSSGGYRGKKDDRGRGSGGFRGKMKDRRGSPGRKSGKRKGKKGGRRKRETKDQQFEILTRDEKENIENQKRYQVTMDYKGMEGPHGVLWDRFVDPEAKPLAKSKGIMNDQNEKGPGNQQVGKSKENMKDSSSSSSKIPVKGKFVFLTRDENQEIEDQKRFQVTMDYKGMEGPNGVLWDRFVDPKAKPLEKKRRRKH